MSVLRVTDDLHAAAKAYAEQHNMKLADVGTVEHMRAIVGASIGVEEHARLLDYVKSLEERLRKAEKYGGSGERVTGEEDPNALILRALSSEMVPLSDNSELPAVEIINWRIARGTGRGGVEVSAVDAVCMLLGTAYGRIMAVARNAAAKKASPRRKAAA